MDVTLALSFTPAPSSRTNALNVSQKMVEMFVRTKHKIDKSHEFALVVVNDDSAWVRLGDRDPGGPQDQDQALRLRLPRSCLA